MAKLAYTVPADTKLTAAAKTASFSYLLPPGKSGTISDLTLSVTIDGITTRTTVSAAELALKAGTYYSVKATLNYNGLTTATLKTTDWDSQPAWNEEVTFVPDFPYVDIGLDFLIAPGNLIATPDGAGGYTYAFAEWQGYYSADPTKGDYFARNMLEPNKENPDDANNWNWTAAHDPCRQVDDGTWYTPTYDQWQTIGATENVWGTYTKGGKTVNGYYFGTKSLSAAQAHPNNYVFLPAAGFRWYHTTFDKANAEGIYLHGEQGDYVVYFAGWGVSLSDMNTGYIGSVRCVKDKPKPKPEHAIEVEGLDFYVADGNLIGTADGNGGYTYAFGEDQGYYAGNVDYSSTPSINTKRDYYSWNTPVPEIVIYDDALSPIWDETRDPCRRVDDGNWYTPTKDQFTLLINHNGGSVWATYTRSDNTTVNGRYFGFGPTGKPSPAEQDKYVFLPAAGDYEHGGIGTAGYCWSATVDANSTHNEVCYLTFMEGTDNVRIDRTRRDYPFNVRCVRPK